MWRHARQPSCLFIAIQVYDKSGLFEVLTFRLRAVDSKRLAWKTRINKYVEVRTEEIHRDGSENWVFLSIPICAARSTMPGDSYIICGNIRKKAPQLSYHRFPNDSERCALWLQVFQLIEEQTRPNSHVFFRHFPNGNLLNKPDLSLGKCLLILLRKELLGPKEPS